MLERIQELAAATSSTVSDVAREALERYVESGGKPAISNVLVSFPRDAGMLLQVRSGHAAVSPNRSDTPASDPTSELVTKSVTY